MKEKVDLSQVVIILLGNKVDDYDNNQITIKQAAVVKDEISANIFEEVSAKQNVNIDEVMDKLATELLDRQPKARSESVCIKNPKKKEKKGCCWRLF